MSKSLKEIFKTIVATYNQSKKKTFDSESIIFKGYRYLSFPITSVFIKLKISANFTTFFSFICIIYSSYLFSTGFLKCASIIYFISFILDFVDGNIARYYNKSNYFGKFIDGLVDSFLYLIFIAIGFNINSAQSDYNKLFFFLSLAISFQILFYYYFNIRINYFNLEIKSKILSTDINIENKILFKKLTFKSIFKSILIIYKELLPIILILATFLNQIYLFIFCSFIVLVIGNTFEIIYKIIILKNKFDLAREY